MKGSSDLRKTILVGLKGLPESSLLEIAEYIFFVRQKTLSPTQFQEQFAKSLMAEELSMLNKSEASHLEEEFQNYQDRFPKE
ncbi:MAG: hypothetical protein AAGI38_15275 [Bacteroidota bacterium]